MQHDLRHFYPMATLDISYYENTIHMGKQQFIDTICHISLLQ